jgi:uncharacterized membrane protein YraQ (UPF0718 family)
MNKENRIKLFLLLGFLCLFLLGSRFHAEHLKAECSEGKCTKPHQHGQLNYHERFAITPDDNFAMVTVKGCANFWEANATGMTFAVILGAAGLSLLLSWKKFETLLETKGIKGAALGSIFGMPLNMCANCSAVTSVSLTSKGGSTEATMGMIFGGALLNIVGFVTMLGLFSPSVIITRLLFSLIMVLVIVPVISKWVVRKDEASAPNPVFNKISCYFPELSFGQTVVKAGEDWLLAAGNIAYKLIPLMLIGTLITALFRAAFPNEVLHHITTYNQFGIIAIISFIGTMLSVPVLFEILLGTILLNIGFSNGAVAAMVCTAPAFGLFTLVLTKNKLGGYKIPLLLLGITFILGIGAGLLAEALDKIF